MDKSLVSSHEKNEREPPFLQRFPLVRGLPSKMSFSKTCYPVALFPKGCLELVSQNCFPPHLVLKCCTCLVYLFSKGFSWGTFFPKVSCGSTFFSKGLLWGYLFSKGLLWSTVFPTSSICSNLFSKGLLFGLGTGCLGSNAASLVGQLLQLFHCVLYLLGFVGSFLKHRL